MYASITTKRYILNSIDISDADLNNYLEWMRDTGSNTFIHGVRANYTIEELKSYIEDKNSSSTALLLGIYDKVSLRHIGNIKLEPLIPFEKACIGILIGETSHRGIGVGTEVIKSVISYASIEFEIKYFYLGVDPANLAAFNLYHKLGFQVNLEPKLIDAGIQMDLRI